MGAKAYLLVCAALASAGCGGGLQRFAPPGIVKYEDLAKDQPVSPAIAERIDASRAETDGGFPKLSEQPVVVPEGIAKPERAAMENALLAERDALAAAIVADKALAAAEREGGLVEARDALSEAIARDDVAARRERGLPPKDVADEAQ
jgi:hypothetical protein